MDEGKAAGPKPKWWSRPRRTSGHQPPPAVPVPPAAEHPHDAGDGTTGDAADAGAGASAPMDTPPPPAADPTDTGAPGVSGAPDGPGVPGASDGAPGSGAVAGGGEASEGAATPATPASSETPAPAPEPLHPEDPYATPPYGGPGPWAPAPLVQPPSGATPPQGVPMPRSGTAPEPQVPQAPPAPSGTPAQGTPVPPQHSAPVPAREPGTHEQGAGAGAGAYEAFPQPSVPHQAQQAHQPLPQAQAPHQPLPQAQPHTPHPEPHPQPPERQTPGDPESVWLRYDPWAPPHAPAPAPVPHGAGGHERGRRRGRTVVGAIVLALVAGGIGGAVGAYAERHGEVGDVTLPQAPAEKEGKNARAPGSIAGIAERALPGVVTLHVSGGGGEATGTGFVLDERGHILTNNHVIEPAQDGGDSVEVTFHGGRTAKGEVIGTDGGYDLAVVKVTGVSGLKPLPLGNSDSVRVGDAVVAIGAPFDLEETVTSGIISAKERPITAGGEQGSETSYVDALQTDAPINPGNSGGPLVDSQGRVVGINSAIKAADDSSGIPGGDEGGSIGLGFAIPVNQGKRVAEELINDGRATHPVIGVTLDTEFDGDGARVGSQGGGGDPVISGSPADEAGIKRGDVITEVEGARVHSGEELIVKIRSHRPGDRLSLTLERDGEERTVRLRLGSSADG
ncbi:trypsin-like peptidase domain-containing protein [Streptomyces sp. NPDC054796]